MREDRKPDRQVDHEHQQIFLGEVGLLDHDHREVTETDDVYENYPAWGPLPPSE